MSAKVHRPKKPADMTVSDRLFRDILARHAFPAALAEFYRTGGAGETWDDYDDMADSVYLAANAMLRRSKRA